VTGPESRLRAVVSRRVLEQGERPRFVYRQPPMGASDSGWSVLVGDESRAELDDPVAMLAHPLDELLAQWPELGAVFAGDEPESAWEWDDASAVYVPRTAGS
jgi:hypothetical protein